MVTSNETVSSQEFISLKKMNSCKTITWRPGVKFFVCITTKHAYTVPHAVADPGFPVGGADLVGGAPTPEAATFQKNLYVKMKNLDPYGARAAAPP